MYYMTAPLPDFFGEPTPEAPKPGSAPNLAGFPEGWSPYLAGTMKLLRGAIDSGWFDDDKVAERLATFQDKGAAGLADLYATARGAMESFAEKTDGWGCTHEEADVAGVPCCWTSWPGQPPEARLPRHSISAHHRRHVRPVAPLPLPIGPPAPPSSSVRRRWSYRPNNSTPGHPTDRATVPRTGT